MMAGRHFNGRLLVSRLGWVAVLCLSVAVGCDRDSGKSGSDASGASEQQRPSAKSKKPAVKTLVEARKGFKTKLPEEKQRIHQPTVVPTPPAGAPFRLVKYAAPLRELPAFLSVVPEDGKKRPGIVWITGGDCNSIGPVWQDEPADNDQTARAFRDAGIVMMFPTLRGGNDTPGDHEDFLGEVDDVIAAGEFLAKQPGVDPNRIYLGGHSTGGTLVLLVAECSPRFRAVFSFGPVGDPSGYGAEAVVFNVVDETEVALRSPARWLADIKTPTWVIEGEEGNIDQLRQMRRWNKNPLVQFIELEDASHFSILRPVEKVLAAKIVADTGKGIEVTQEELQKAVAATAKQ